MEMAITYRCCGKRYTAYPGDGQAVDAVRRLDQQHASDSPDCPPLPEIPADYGQR